MMSASNPSAEACPNCGSPSVRWRRRRFHDVVFTYLRHSVDALLGTIFRGTGSTVTAREYSERWGEAQFDAFRYDQERRVDEHRVGTMTAARFWRCPACRQKGHVFEELDDVLERRQRLLGLQERLEDNFGTANHPIDHDPKAD